MSAGLLSFLLILAVALVLLPVALAMHMELSTRAFFAVGAPGYLLLAVMVPVVYSYESSEAAVNAQGSALASWLPPTCGAILGLGAFYLCGGAVIYGLLRKALQEERHLHLRYAPRGRTGYTVDVKRGPAPELVPLSQAALAFQLQKATAKKAAWIWPVFLWSTYGFSPKRQEERFATDLLERHRLRLFKEAVELGFGSAAVITALTKARTSDELTQASLALEQEKVCQTVAARAAGRNR